LPCLKEKGIKIAEIISDYRQPRPGDLDDSTRPGETGYESGKPEEKNMTLNNYPLHNWAEKITWDELRKIL